MADTKTSDSAPVAAPVPRLRTHYRETVRAKLVQQFGFDNPHRVPRLVKIVWSIS